MFYRQLILIFVALVGSIVLVGMFGLRPLSFILPSASHMKTITIGTTTIQVEVADTETSRTQGLSGRASLTDGSGMLFVFESEGSWGIWMKDMQFPIDIIFADQAGVASVIYHNVLPESYPEVFYPKTPALYVLEVPGGYAKKAGIVEGTKIQQNK